MNLFYIPELTPSQQEITLSEEESRHACKVLRLKTGDQIALLDGRGGDYLGEITGDHPKHCEVKILSHTFEAAPQHEIHIAIAPTKNNDRIEWFLEKTTELGITEITLLLCKNSERRQSREDRFEKILIAAMKQSQRTYLPKLNALTPFPEFLKKYPQGALAHCADGAKNGLSEAFRPQQYPILIGPEGDFTAEEIQLAEQSGYDFITLGKNRLRTETAGLYACMLALQEIH
jgi:16S rRNA (uracil1498-N3)-methyltransferase